MGGRYDEERGGRPEVLGNLRTELLREAQGHRPNRERILARVERGIATPGGLEPWREDGRGHRSPYGPAAWARMVGVTAGLVGAFAVGGLAVTLTTNAGGPDPQTVVTSPGPAAPPDVPTLTVSPTHRPVAPPTATLSVSPPATGNVPGGASSPATSTPTAAPNTQRGNHPQDGYLWSDGSVNAGSNDYWAQSDVMVQNGQPLTELTVELRIVNTGGVFSTGSWSTIPTYDYDVTVREDDGALVYRWTLKSGKTVPAGTHLFAGQYNHAEGARDAGGDLYAAQGDGSGGAVEVRGDFS